MILSRLTLPPIMTRVVYQAFFIAILVAIGASSALARTINITRNNVSRIQSIINNEASNGDILFFNQTGEYNLANNRIVINKALTLQGVNPSNFNNATRGASGLRTTLINASTIVIASNNVTIKNLQIIENPAVGSNLNNFSILLDGRTQNYKNNFRSPESNDGQTWSGITVDNVELNGGFYGCFSGNGLNGTFEHVSFTNFRRIGYIMDRRARIAFAPKITFDRCLFQPNVGVITFDNRGISLDAGNTEYPLVWDFQQSIVKNSTFENTGIALSRCQQFNITSNVFNDFEAAIDLVHIEEWSNNVVVNGNTFNCMATNPNNLTRIIQLDRELQRTNFVFINNNRITGNFNFFVNAYGSSDIYINDNNFTGSSAVNTIISHTFYESRAIEPIKPFQEFVSFNMEVLRNTNLSQAVTGQNKAVSMHVLPNNGGNINITNGLSRNLIVKNFPTGLISNGVYEVINQQNGRKLASNGNSSQFFTKPGSTSDNSVRWEFSFDPPYYFNIKNRGNNRYLEAHKGYTEAEIFEGVPEDEYPFLSNSGIKPRWSLVETSSPNVYEIFTGGNEKQSALAHDFGNGAQLIMGREFSGNIRVPVNFTDRAKWRFVRVGNLRLSPTQLSETTGLGNIFEVSPNPAQDVLMMKYENIDESTASFQLINMRGKTVRSGKLFSHAINGIDTSDLPTGIYIMKTSNGDHKKVIIE